MFNSQKGMVKALIMAILAVLILIGVFVAVNKPSGEVEDEFTYERGALYSQTRSDLVGNGWNVYLPVRDSEEFVSANDPQYPEIGGCGEGYDAICNVMFVKEGESMNLNVEQEDRGGKLEWIVVGSE